MNLSALSPAVGCVAVLLLSVSSAAASTISFAGNLRTNATVTACGPSCTLGAANSDGEYAQYAAVVLPFTVATPSLVGAVSFSYGGGINGAGMTIAQSGFEPYLSLFTGSGGFLGSSFGSGCPPGAHSNSVTGACYDAGLTAGVLAAGTYQIAISAFENLSYAENLGSGTLADGFTGLGNLYAGEDLHYALDVSLTPSSLPPTPAVPEPATLVLVGSAVSLASLARLRGRRSTTTHVLPKE